MFFLSKGITFVRFLIFFMLGIAVGITYPIPINFWIFPAVFAGYILVHIFWKNQTFIKSAIAWGILFLGGILLVNIRTEKNLPEHFIHSRESILYYEAKVISTPERTLKSQRVVVQVNRIKMNASEWSHASGKILAYISGNTSALINKGDLWLIKGSPSLPMGPSNPGQFDYASYLNRQNIFAVHFLWENQLVKIGHVKEAWWIRYSDDFRNFCESELRKGIKGDNEYYLSVALILGGKAGLDEKLYQAYSETGTVHALAVSGLHVSLIYFIVIFLLGFLKKIRYGKYLFVSLSILVFWFYAMVTGFSPSVVRAVTMFSVFLIASILKRNSGIYNTLAFSAFIILCVEPFWLMDIGFQFSFLAVAGIAYLYPIIYGWRECRNFILDKLWSLVCLSTAAQLAVAPLSVYYFHSFPLLFLPFNMLIVPLSSLALYTGLAGLISFKITFLTKGCMWATEYLVKFMNYLVQLPSGSPFLRIDFLFLSVQELVFLYLFVILFFYALKNKKHISFIWSVGALFLFSISVLGNSFYNFHQKLFAVYHIKDKTVLAFIDHGNALVLSDSQLTVNDKDFRFNVYNHLSQERIRNVSFASFYGPTGLTQKNFPFGQLMVWQGIKILRITKPPNQSISQDLYTEFDYLIVSDQHFYRKIKNANLLLKKNQIMIDSHIREKSSRMREDFYYINRRGAFIDRRE